LALSWSGGKDSALVWTLRGMPLEPDALITTVTETYERISMHLTLNGPVVYGGYGCPDSAPIPSSEDTPRVLDIEPGEEKIIGLQRGQPAIHRHRRRPASRAKGRTRPAKSRRGRPVSLSRALRVVKHKRWACDQRPVEEPEEVIAIARAA